MNEMPSEPTQAEWFAAVGGEKRGPLRFDELAALVAEGTITPLSLVWKSGMGDWRAAREVAELDSLFPVRGPDAFPPPLPASGRGRKKSSPSFPIILGGLVCCGLLVLAAMRYFPGAVTSSRRVAPVPAATPRPSPTPAPASEVAALATETAKPTSGDAAGDAKATELQQIRLCQEMLLRIDGAKEQWALETNKAPGVVPAQADLDGGGNGQGYLKQMPVCPLGFKYIINAIGHDPVCSSGLPGHSIKEIGETLVKNRDVAGAAAEEAAAGFAEQVRGDLKSIGAALEDYNADAKEYPLPLPEYHLPSAIIGAENRSYLEQSPADPFAADKGYRYFRPRGEYAVPGWIVWSPGPDGVYDISDPLGVYDQSQAGGPTPYLLRVTYDPSNGVVSGGDIWLTAGRGM